MEAQDKNGIKILVIGNYPPPMCGWAIQTYLVTVELRRRGQICDVLKINENRRVKSSAYVNVQSGWDYFTKLVRFTLRGYRINVHVNGTSRKGYLLALIATAIGRLSLRPASLTYHGGIPQEYFPRHDSWKLYHAFRLLFQSAGKVACDSVEIKQAIVEYGINPGKISAIATFSPQYLKFTPARLSGEVEKFLSEHEPVFFSYLAFRPEYQLGVMREGMKQFREKYPRCGFIWLGFSDGELQKAQAFINGWAEEERRSLLLLGNLPHDEFLTVLTRCSACLRSPACDGVAASVLEALFLGVPVVASENGRRPEGVIAYRETDAADMCAKMVYAIENRDSIRQQLAIVRSRNHEEDNVACMTDWLTESARGV
jgi:glycosyltransferase involved in cell wall biosynthesis